MVVCQNPSETGECPQSDQVAQAVFGQAANVDPVTGQATFVQASFDATPPEITPVLNPAPNANGWNNTNVTVTWSVIDPQSGILSSVGCDDRVVTTDRDHHRHLFGHESIDDPRRRSRCICDSDHQHRQDAADDHGQPDSPRERERLEQHERDRQLRVHGWSLGSGGGQSAGEHGRVG